VVRPAVRQQLPLKDVESLLPPEFSLQGRRCPSVEFVCPGDEPLLDDEIPQTVVEQASGSSERRQGSEEIVEEMVLRSVLPSIHEADEVPEDGPVAVQQLELDEAPTRGTVAEHTRSPPLGTEPIMSPGAELQEDDEWPQLSAGMRAIQGRWQRRRNANVLHVIDGQSITGPRGMIAQISELGPDQYGLHLDGTLHRGRLRGAHMLWDDGDVWIHEESVRIFNGIWAHEFHHSEREFITGDLIHGMKAGLPPMEIDFRTKSAIRIWSSEVSHVGTLLSNDRISWSDGDIWVRLSPEEIYDGQWRARDSRKIFVVNGSVVDGPLGRYTITLMNRAILVVDFGGRLSRGWATAACILWEDGDIWELCSGSEEVAEMVSLDANDQAAWIAEVRNVTKDWEASLGARGDTPGCSTTRSREAAVDRHVSEHSTAASPLSGGEVC